MNRYDDWGQADEADPFKPWWLPADLRLTVRGSLVLDYAIAMSALLILLVALAVAGKVEGA